MQITGMPPFTMAQQQFPDLQVQMKDEEPRLRNRIVPMKVLVLGYPRTGTSCSTLSLFTSPSVTNICQQCKRHLNSLASAHAITCELA